MNGKIKVGILGATGMVGQNYIVLLADHPRFEVSFLAASERSAGQIYGQAIEGRWRMETSLPDRAGKLPVHRVDDIAAAGESCALVFSAFNADKETTRRLEREYAAAGIPVVSNNSAHRLTDNVPILMPEVNPELLDIIPRQRAREGWERGFIVTTNLQALSGAGYPGQSALDVIDNIIALPSEEEKALCEPQRLGLPSAPSPAIRYFNDQCHPQPRLNRDADGGMAVTVGRLQKSPVLGYRFTALSHNTRRGAAGGAVLTAELMAAKGFLE